MLIIQMIDDVTTGRWQKATEGDQWRHNNIIFLVSVIEICKNWNMLLVTVFIISRLPKLLYKASKVLVVFTGWDFQGGGILSDNEVHLWIP